MRTHQHVLHVDYRLERLSLGGDDRAAIEADLEPLVSVAEDFPVANLHISITQHARSGEITVLLSLALSDKTLVTGETDDRLSHAFKSSVRQMIKAVEAYKEKLGAMPEKHRRAQGTRHVVEPAGEPNIKALDQAAARGDFASFRNSIGVFDTALEQRIGRWIQRYPAIEERLARDLTLSDLLDALYLFAFEDFARRPGGVPLAEWLENLVDKTVRAFQANPEAEMQNVRAVRTWTDF